MHVFFLPFINLRLGIYLHMQTPPQENNQFPNFIWELVFCLSPLPPQLGKNFQITFGSLPLTCLFFYFKFLLKRVINQLHAVHVQFHAQLHYQENYKPQMMREVGFCRLNKRNEQAGLSRATLEIDSWLFLFSFLTSFPFGSDRHCWYLG